MSMPDVQEQGMYGYFLRELDYLRTRAKDFSEDYPRVAHELQLSQGKSSDPHVELLLQAFAYLTGSLRRDMDAEESTLPNQLLSILYPHLVKPLPSMFVVQPEVIPDGANFEGGWKLDVGRELYANAEGSKGSRVRCNMRVCYETILRPLEVNDVSFIQAQDVVSEELPDEVNGALEKAHSILRVNINNTGPDPIHAYGLDNLCFFISGMLNKPESAYAIYDLLANDLLSVAVRNKANGEITILPVDNLQWRGFSMQEAALPYHTNSHHAYRILQEYFSFPEKFLFFDIEGIESKGFTREFELMFLLDRVPGSSLVPDSHCLRLNCIPLVNLFRKQLNPVRLDEQRHEYRLIGDSRNHAYCEVHSILDVQAVPKEGAPERLHAYMGIDYDLLNEGESFYSTRLELSELKSVPGTESFISVHRNKFDLNDTVDDVLSISSLCTNRRLPESMRVGEALKLQGPGPIRAARIVTKPSMHQAPRLNKSKSWQLVSNLSLNHLSLAEDGLDAFKHILQIYSDERSKSHYVQVASIKDLSCRRIVQHIGKDQWRGFCRGMEVSLSIDEDMFDGGSIILFGEVLRRFLGMYVNVNSFTKVKLFTEQRKSVFKEWQALAGEQIVL